MNEEIYMSLSSAIWTRGGRREDLVQRVANAIRDGIRSGRLPAGSKLIPEAELARQIGVSRPSLREATRILAHEGLIVIKHGVGTFVGKNTKPMLGTLELMRSMTDMIRAAGGEPSERELSVTLLEPPAAVADELALSPSVKVGMIGRVRLANDRPFAVAKEYVVLDGGQHSFEALSRFPGGSLYAFLRGDFALSISHSKSVMTAVSADAHTAQVLDLKRGAPLLLMEETHFDAGGRPVLFSVNLHNTDAVKFTSMRSGAPM